MRRIGILKDSALAQQFCDYLVTLSIDAMTDPESQDSESDWNIWVRDERQIDQAKQALAEFQLDPQHERYQVKREASRIREDQLAEQKRAEKRVRAAAASSSALGEPINAPLKQPGIPVTIAVIVFSILASLTSNFGDPRPARQPGKTTLEEKIFFGMSFVDRRDYFATNQNAFASVGKGQVWRFVTPMFLHGDTFHLLFNMLWIYFLGSVIERLHGSIFFAVLTITTQIAGMLLQVMLPGTDVLTPIFQGTPVSFLAETLSGSPFAIGASGAVYGLFGFLWIRPKVDPGYPIHLVQTNVVLMLGWLVLCMTPLIPGVANGAHLGGLIAGVGFGYAGKFMRR